MADFTFAQGYTLRVSAGPGNATVRLTAGTAIHRLAIAMDVSSVSLPNDVPIQLSGEVYAELNRANRWLGPLIPKTIGTRRFQTSELLACGLSDSQLRGIEALREGCDLRLRLNLDAVLLHGAEGLYPIVQAQEVAFVTAEAWARQLEGLGTVVVTEVLVPLPFDGTELRGAVGRIREAKGHITDGKYEEAVRSARLALDYVLTACPPDSSAHQRKARERTQDQRWSVLVDDIYRLASGANHDDSVTESFTWSRDDAVAIVSAVAGLLARLPRDATEPRFR